MSRSGYTDDFEDIRELNMWRGAVQSAIRGKRGQAFLREMLAALDALPEKELVEEELEAGPLVCAIGSVGRARGIDMSTLDPEDHDKLANTFGIARVLVQEIEFINDHDFAFKKETPAERFVRVRAWVEKQIAASERG